MACEPPLLTGEETVRNAAWQTANLSFAMGVVGVVWVVLSGLLQGLRFGEWVTNHVRTQADQFDPVLNLLVPPALLGSASSFKVVEAIV